MYKETRVVTTNKPQHKKRRNEGFACPLCGKRGGIKFSHRDEVYVKETHTLVIYNFMKCEYCGGVFKGKKAD